MKIRYHGRDTFEFTYGVVYEVVREVLSKDGGIVCGVVCYDNLDDEMFLSRDFYEVIAE